MQNRPPKLSRRFHPAKIYLDKGLSGQGVFAGEKIHSLSPVGRILGEIKPPGYRSDYCMSYQNGAIEPDPPFRFVNHSCEPNCEIIEWQITDPETGKNYYELWLHSLRAIEKGQELTIDYGWDMRAAIPCHCGAAHCRGWICRLDELNECILERGTGSLE